MQTARFKIRFVCTLPPHTFDREGRRPVELAHHHALLNLGDLLGCHAKTERGGKWHLLLVEPRHAFQRLIDVRLNGYLHIFYLAMHLPFKFKSSFEGTSYFPRHLTIINEFKSSYASINV